VLRKGGYFFKLRWFSTPEAQNIRPKFANTAVISKYVLIQVADKNL